MNILQNKTDILAKNDDNLQDITFAALQQQMQKQNRKHNIWTQPPALLVIFNIPG